MHASKLAAGICPGVVHMKLYSIEVKIKRFGLEIGDLMEELT